MENIEYDPDFYKKLYEKRDKEYLDISKKMIRLESYLMVIADMFFLSNLSPAESKIIKIARDGLQRGE